MSLGKEIFTKGQIGQHHGNKGLLRKGKTLV